MIRNDLFVVALLYAFASVSHAAMLTDGNSFVQIDPGSQAGVSAWNVDGVNHLSQQWFWYRVGQTAEQSIDSLALNGTQLVDADNDGQGDDKITLDYSGAGFDVEISYTLKGGLAGSGDSDLGEAITITNTNEVPMNISFFQYSNFNLENDGGSGDAAFITGSTARQEDGTSSLSETVVEPTPLRGEVGLDSTTIDKLNDAVADDLDFTIAGNPIIFLPGTGDATWAYQWDFVIPVDGMVTITKNKNLTSTVVPSPSAAAAGVVMFTGLALQRERRRAGKSGCGR